MAHVFAHNGRPRTHLRGDHFHFSQQIFILSREGFAAGASGWATILRGKISYAPQSATSNRPVLSPPGLRTSTLHTSIYQRTSTLPSRTLCSTTAGSI